MTDERDQDERAPSTELTEQDKAAVKAVFEKVRKGLAGFKARRSQNVMIAEVARTVGPEAGGVTVIEAGTGCGKSLGYLIPSVPLAARKEMKLIVSTGTVALQEQLMRELPQFLKMAGREETVALIKGRQRYVCVRDLFSASGEGGGAEQLGFEEAVFSSRPSAQDTKVITSLAKSWIQKRWDGDMDNAPERITDPVRMAITTTHGGCTGRRCPNYDECPLIQARRKAKEADIVLSNHSLLLADLEPREGVEPILGDLSKAVVCIDEAHQFAQDAINAGAAHVPLTATSTRLRKANKLVTTIYKIADEGEIAGLPPEAVVEAITAVCNDMDALEKDIKISWSPRQGDRDQEWRAPNGQLPEHWRQHAQGLANGIEKLIGWLDSASRAIRSAKGGYGEQARRDTGVLAERLDGYRKLFKDWAAPDPDTLHPTARWITLGNDQGIVCHASPTDASEFLKMMFWGRVHAVVFTSATISAGGDFTAFNRELAIPGHVEPTSLPSPFDLERQATLEVPFFHNEPNAAGHPREVSDWLQAKLDWAQGSLVLFTSWRKMTEVAGMLTPEQRGLVKMQGDFGKTELIQRHKQDIDAGKGSVIFGLQSMGEGIDLPGKYCGTVVITQLPFGRLTDPVKATYAEWLESHGRNAFMEMTLPHAMLRLTQYAGRLIRSETDTGRIVITDSRLRTKRYGSTFMDGLPPFRRLVERRPPAQSAVNS